jgi:hypothetical protein
MKVTRFRELIELLSAANVEFIVVGGVAGNALGNPRITLDLDVVYRRTPENLQRIVNALSPLSPYPRDAPPGLPFKWDWNDMFISGSSHPNPHKTRSRASKGFSGHRRT